MSRASVWLLVVVSVLVACDRRSSKQSEAAAPAPSAVVASPAEPQGQSFGGGVKLGQATPIEAILAAPKDYRGKTVRVEGMVVDVCPKRGCWFELAGAKPGEKLRFKVVDGEMVFPPDSKGRKAIAEGVVSVTELTLEQTKERAAYEAKEYGKPYDPAAVTAPALVVRIDGTGAIFL